MRPSILSITALVVLASVGRVNAESVTFAFTGTVEDVFDGLNELDNSVVPGTTTFTGYYTFHTDVPNTAEPQDEGQPGLYHHDAPPAGVRIEVGNYIFRTVSATPDFDVIVNNEVGITGADEYGFLSRNNEALGLRPGAPVDRLNISWFASTFRESPLDSAALPLTPPDLLLFDSNQLTIKGECTPCLGPAAYFTIGGPLTSLTLVPEPSIVGLAAFSLLGLALHGWRRRR